MEQTLNVPLSQTTEIICKCGGNIFTEGLILRKASKILMATSQDAIVPIPIMYCTKCNKVLEETLPSALKEKPTPPPTKMLREGEDPNKQEGKIIKM
jgi:hypothetical protein